MQEKQNGQNRLSGGLFWVVLTAVACALLFWEGFKKAFSALLLPFGIAFAAAKLVRPLGLKLSKIARVNPKSGCTVWGLLLCLGAGLTVSSLSGSLWEQLSSVTQHIPSYAKEFSIHVSDLSHKVSAYLPFLREGESTSKLGTLVSGAFEEAASSLGSAAAGALGSAVSTFPGGVLSLFIGVLAFLYMTADMDGIGKSIRTLLTCFFSEDTVERISHGFLAVTDAMLGYLRSCLLLMLTTFLLLSLGFFLLGTGSPLMNALLVSFIDALPLFGCGIVLIPWAIWCFLEGNVARGVGLLVLQIIVYGVRQLLEPRLIGKMSGVHPFVALLVLFAGLKIGGVAGMILAPILLIAILRSRSSA